MQIETYSFSNDAHSQLKKGSHIGKGTYKLSFSLTVVITSTRILKFDRGPRPIASDLPRQTSFLEIL